MNITLISLLSFAGYYFTNHLPYKYVWRSSLDKFVPLEPLFLIPYVSLFPYLLLSYLLLMEPIHSLFAIAITICNVLATVFWTTLPNGIPRQNVKTAGWSKPVLDFIYRHDGDNNGLPSGHVYLSVICSYFLSLQYPSLLWLLIIWGSTIAISTVLVKQHFLVDILDGLVFAAVSIWLSHYLTIGVI